MNLKLKFIILLILPPLLIGSYSYGHNEKPIDEELDLIDKGVKIENSIILFTTDLNYERLKATTGEKFTLDYATLIINGDTLKPEGINTRGGSTLLFRRKSYSFSLKNEASFTHGERKESFKKFYVLSLSMDRNYSSNRLAFELMEKIKLFNLFYSFCELSVNGKSEGIGMVVERPEDWAIKKKGSPLIIRRGYNHNIDKIQSGKVVEKSEAKKYSDYYKLIYKSLNKYEGEELYNKLSNWLDIDNYFRWLAFNFLLRNGDYTDEVFFYIDPEIDKFNIIPWDYDDLFLPAPHEGKAARLKALGDKLIFSSEDLLDTKIASDPYLYNMYLLKFREVLTQLTPVALKKAFEDTYAELFPYFSDHEIIGMSRYDSHKDTDLDKLETDMKSLFGQLNITLGYYYSLIKSTD